MDESDHHALMCVRHGQTVRQEGVGEVSARAKTASLGGYDVTAVDVEIDPQCSHFRRSQTNFALQAIVERCAAVVK